MDRRLARFAEQKGFVYTRYTVDFTFLSGSMAALAKSTSAYIAHIVRDSGLVLNGRKYDWHAQGAPKPRVDNLSDADVPRYTIIVNYLGRLKEKAPSQFGKLCLRTPPQSATEEIHH